eukprot:scaffold5181_cov125-Isochrysis_galbana.AAC.6
MRSTTLINAPPPTDACLTTSDTAGAAAGGGEASGDGPAGGGAPAELAEVDRTRTRGVRGVHSEQHATRRHRRPVVGRICCADRRGSPNLHESDTLPAPDLRLANLHQRLRLVDRRHVWRGQQRRLGEELVAGLRRHPELVVGAVACRRRGRVAGALARPCQEELRSVRGPAVFLRPSADPAAIAGVHQAAAKHQQQEAE